MIMEMKKKEMEGHGYTFIDQIRRAKKMNNTLEKELNEYREDLQELTNSDLLIEYKYSCIEVERLRKLFRNNSDNKNLQNSLDYEKQIEKICMDNIISRMGVHKKLQKERQTKSF